jgi:RNA polymerase sigma factor (sigma-70 family)
MNESKILELFKVRKGLTGKKSEANLNELFKTILDSPEVRKALTTNTWARSFEGDMGECESIVNAGILKAIQLFDLKKHKNTGKFSTFLWTVINQEFSRNYERRYIRGLRTLGKRKISFESLDAFEGIDIPEPNLDQDTLIKQIIDSATPNEQLILNGLLNGLTFREIAKEVNCTIWCITALVKKLHERYS